MNKVQQPHLDPTRRLPDGRSFLPGFVLSLAGLLLVLFGLGRITGVEKVSGDLALETEVNIAIAHGGVRYVVEQQAEPGFETQQLRRAESPERLPGAVPRRFFPGTARLCIDLTSKEPCPT